MNEERRLRFQRCGFFSRETRVRGALMVIALAGSIPSAAAWIENGVALTTADELQTNARITSDGFDGAIVCWVDLRSGEADIYAQRITAAGAIAAGWPSDGLAICTSSGNQRSAGIVTDGAGGAIIVWEDERNGDWEDIYAQRVTGSGTIASGWSVNGVALCTAYEIQQFPVISSDAAGGAIVAWAD